jgi:hypothetical protein
VTDFVTAVATRAEASEKRAEAVLTEYGIPLLSPRAVRRGLTVERLAFSGTKTIEDRAEEPFSFERHFTTGVWCVTSRRNLVGKSTVLNLILWALRGQPGPLRADVRGWLDHVELDASVDGEEITVRFDVVGGSPRGELIRRSAPMSPLAAFDSHDSFERAVAGYIMDRLRLDPTRFWQRRPNDPEERGDQRLLGWQSYATALYIPEASFGAVLGEQTISGQAGILLQVFVGVPWTATYHAARVAERHAAQQRSVGQAAAREAAQARGSRRADLEGRLVAAQSTLSALSPTPSASEIDDAVGAYQRAAERQGALSSQVIDCQRELEAANILAAEDEQYLLDLRETLAARPFFAKLNPTRCPRCEHELGAERNEREAQTHHCAVCDSIVAGQEDAEEAAERLAAAETQHADTKTQAEAMQARYTALSEQLAAATAETEALRREVDRLTGQPAQLAAWQN